MTSRGRKRPPDEEIDGSWFRQCERCGVTSDDDRKLTVAEAVGPSFWFVTSCGILGRTWLCSYCRDDHRRDCPICKGRRAA